MSIALVAPFGLRVKDTARALPLARELASRGHAVALFVPPYDSPQDSGRRWTEGGVDVINVPLPGTWWQGGALWHLRLAWRLLRAVRAWQPDVVHVFKPKGPAGLVGAVLWMTRRTTNGKVHRMCDERRTTRFVVGLIEVRWNSH